MKKPWMITVLGLAIFSVILLAGCKPVTEGGPTGPLVNDSLNQAIENLTKTNITKEEFKEFDFNYTPRIDAKYEIAKDDVFNLSKGNLTSTEISFLGVKLGDSYQTVLEKLGIPDTMYTAADKSYKNMDYFRKIGINTLEPAITYHIENDTVIRVTVKPAFNKYLHGNTAMGQTKEYIYGLFDVPDYQDFVSNLRVFHYVEKGMEIYLKTDKTNILSFILPRDFKGVKYVTVLKDMGDGVFFNVTEPVLTE